MPGPPHLPTEILREIFSSLTRVDLGKVCLISNRFHQIATPFLYQVVDLVRDPIDEIAVPYFLRAVLSRPDLAEYVHVLRLAWFSDQEMPMHSDSSYQRDGSDIALFPTAGESCGLTPPTFSRGSQIILLLKVLPFLYEFDIIDSSTCNSFSDFLESTLDLPVTSLPAALKSISRFSTFMLANTPTMLVALLMLPVISDIDVILTYPEEAPEAVNHLNRRSPEQYYGSSSVTKLRFQDSIFSTSLLSTLLQLPLALTHFTYDDDQRCNTPDECPAFSQAMAHLRPTLQYLCLGWVRVLQFPGSSRNGEERKTIGPLRDWPVLRTVKCPLTALVGKPAPGTPRLVDVLPVVIIELTISRSHTSGSPSMRHGQWTVEDMTDQILQLLEEKEVCGLRDLTRLTAHTDWRTYKGDGWAQDHVISMEETLGAACIAHGVVGLQIAVDPIVVD